MHIVVSWAEPLALNTIVIAIISNAAGTAAAATACIIPAATVLVVTITQTIATIAIGPQCPTTAATTGTVSRYQQPSSRSVCTTPTTISIIATDCTKITGCERRLAVLDKIQLAQLHLGRSVAELLVERTGCSGRRYSCRGLSRGRRVQELLPVVHPLAKHLVQRL